MIYRNSKDDANTNACSINASRSGVNLAAPKQFTAMVSSAICYCIHTILRYARTLFLSAHLKPQEPRPRPIRLCRRYESICYTLASTCINYNIDIHLPREDKFGEVEKWFFFCSSLKNDGKKRAEDIDHVRLARKLIWYSQCSMETKIKNTIRIANCNRRVFTMNSVCLSLLHLTAGCRRNCWLRIKVCERECKCVRVTHQRDVFLHSFIHSFFTCIRDSYHLIFFLL